jgi:hypothetical protein
LTVDVFVVPEKESVTAVAPGGDVQLPAVLQRLSLPPPVQVWPRAGLARRIRNAAAAEMWAERVLRTRCLMAFMVVSPSPADCEHVWDAMKKVIQKPLPTTLFTLLVFPVSSSPCVAIASGGPTCLSEGTVPTRA